MAFAMGFAGEGKPAPQTGAVADNAIKAEADAHCAKAAADCPKGSDGKCAKGHAGRRAGHAEGTAAKSEVTGTQIMASEGADCPKSAECPKHDGLKHKAGEAKASPASGTPAAKPADADKASSHPG
jgi:hypothetical protein